MAVSESDLAELVQWRHRLHAMPEVSGEEVRTAEEVVRFLASTKPDDIITRLGGTGVAVVFNGGKPGPTLMFRAELDALPIHELSAALPHRSQIPGKGHMCGHDGHMAILGALAREFGHTRPSSGRVILLFQPAEETGAGAKAVLDDPRFETLKPDFAFSLHNMPGLPLGHSWIKAGAANCASCGLKIRFTGKTAHASQPEAGLSPAPAIAELVPRLNQMSRGQIEDEDLVLATVTHLSVGEPAFGIAPGEGEIWVTLRSVDDAAMAGLRAQAEALATQLAARYGLSVELSYHDEFRACSNHPEAVEAIRHAMDAEGFSHEAGQIFRASEDFGRFGDVAKSAMFFLGAGETHPALHNPDYDFPDALIPFGARIFLRIARNTLG